jgi:hypothetical protein
MLFVYASLLQCIAEIEPEIIQEAVKESSKPSVTSWVILSLLIAIAVSELLLLYFKKPTISQKFRFWAKKYGWWVRVLGIFTLSFLIYHLWIVTDWIISGFL